MTTNLEVLINEFDPIERILKNVSFAIGRTYKFIYKLAGYLGLIASAPLFILAAALLWLLLKYSNYKTKKTFYELFKIVHKVEQRDLILLHHDIKKYRLSNESVLKTFPEKDFFLIKPLVANIAYSLRMFKDAEDRLHKCAYPHLYIPLTEVQKKQLQNLSLDFEGIWDDNDCVVLK